MLFWLLLQRCANILAISLSQADQVPVVLTEQKLPPIHQSSRCNAFRETSKTCESQGKGLVVAHCPRAGFAAVWNDHKGLAEASEGFWRSVSWTFSTRRSEDLAADPQGLNLLGSELFAQVPKALRSGPLEVGQAWASVHCVLNTKEDPFWSLHRETKLPC